jgi:hypothetical protein
MRFYDVSSEMLSAIEAGDLPLRVRIEIDLSRNGAFTVVDEKDVIQADFYSLKESGGGTAAYGEVLLDNPAGRYLAADGGAGVEVRVWFTVGELPWFRRFTLFADERGLQDIRGPWKRRQMRIIMRDGSWRLRVTERERDWTNPAEYAECVVCDAGRREKSLVHLLAKRAGIEKRKVKSKKRNADDGIRCGVIGLNVCYALLTRNIWDELSEIAWAYRAQLEFDRENTLVFDGSVYETNIVVDDFTSYTFRGEQVYRIRARVRRDLYRNAVRFKANMPVLLSKREVYAVPDAGVNSRKKYKYYTYDRDGNQKAVVFFDEVEKVTDNNTFLARPVALDLNRTHIVYDALEVEKNGTQATNVTGKYFSDDTVLASEMKQYEHWVAAELAERVKTRTEIIIETHRAFFHARVGAKIRIKTREADRVGIVGKVGMHYRKDKAFWMTMRIVSS